MTWEPYYFKCCECGRGMDERRDTVWGKVTGWEKKRHAGGTNHIACRRPLDEFMCDACMRKVLAGVPAGQDSLWNVG